MTVRNKIRGRTATAIAASVEQAVQGGGWQPGQLLPPVRTLAATLRVSPVTVAAAYRQLRLRGVVLTDGRRGTRIRPAAADPPLPRPSAARFLSERATDSSTMDLASGNPDPDLLPPLEPALRILAAGPDLYGTEAVLPELRAFAAGELSADGIAAGTLAVTHGGFDAIERLFRDQVRPGDRVAIEDPSLPGLQDLVVASGYVAEPMALDADGPRPEAMEAALSRGVRAAVVSPRGQNPTGVAITPARAAELARLLRCHPDVLLIENDAVSAIAGTPAVTLSPAVARWAHVRSVSKFLGPDLRVALVAGDALTIGRLAARQAVGARWVSHLLQRLTVALWSDPSAGRRLARASDVYERRRRALTEALVSHGITVTARSGFNVWIPVREETAAVQWLAERGWMVAAGERFRLRSAPGIRITTSALAPAAASRLASDCAAALRPVLLTSA